MRDSQRFSRPCGLVRPPGSRLLEAYSPKLGRRVQFAARLDFLQWVRLEADPDVTSFCERPTRLGGDDAGPLISFWVQRQRTQEFVLLARHDTPANLPADHEGVALRCVAQPELTAASVWVGNWLRMLGVISRTSSLLSETFKSSVLAFVDAPTPLSDIERRYSAGDPMLARGAAFELLRTGALAAPSLRTEPLCLHSMWEPGR